MNKANQDTAFDQNQQTQPNAAEDNPEYSKPSKSQLKRDMHSLQALGEELVALSKERLKSLNLPENLYDAVLEAQRTRTHEGKRRQMQFIGKLMRQAEVAPIKAQLAEWANHKQTDVAAFHEVERWRERLLSADMELDAFIHQYPEVEIQPLRQLIRAARKEQAEQKPLKNFRLLFQRLREILKVH